MNFAVRVRPDAELDLADAALWYEDQKTDLGHQFLNEVLSVFSQLGSAPLLHPVIHKNTHRALLQRFPFAIYYRVEAAAVVVIAVMHGSRHPYRWKGRI